MNRPVRFVAAAKDPNLPKGVRWIYLAAALYILSPIDVVPEVIPVLGVMDDLLVILLAFGPALTKWRQKKQIQ